MTKIHGWSAAVLALLCLLGGVIVPRAAELDEVESALRAEYDVPLRWENLGPDLWVAGPMPRRSAHREPYFVSLSFGKPVTFRTPPGVALRFVGNCKTLKSHDLDVAVSNGSGLFVQIPVVATADENVLLAFPQSHESMLVRVGVASPQCPTDCIAVFVSRYDSLPDLAPYRGRICLPYKPVRVRRSDEAAALDFWAISPGEPQSLSITGPTRIAVHSRYRYPPGEARMFQFYRIHVLLDGIHHQTLEYETTLEPRFQVFVDGVEERVSRNEVAYLEVPAGNHRLTFDSTGPIYLCPYQLESPDFLLPGRNQPRLTAEEARLRFTPLVSPLSPWEITQQKANRILATPPAFVADRERLALRLARDNRHREGGLTAAMLARATGVARPDYPRVGQSAEDSLLFHTFYRGLYPIANVGTTAPLRGYFTQRRLTRPGEQSFLPPAPSLLVDDILDNLGNASFLAVASERENAAVYPVPERYGPSDLRVVAVEILEGGGREFFVQLDQHPPTRLAFGARLVPTEYVGSRAEVALALGAGSTSPAATLDVPFARGRTPAPFLSVGTAQVPLPTGVKKVRVWSDGPAPGLRLALQYRTGKPYRLSETEFLDHYRRVGGIPSWSVLSSFFRGEALPEGMNESHRELANQYVPLLRLVTSRYEQFRSAVVPLTRIKMGQARMAPAEPAELEPVSARKMQRPRLPPIEVLMDNEPGHATNAIAQRPRLPPIHAAVRSAPVVEPVPVVQPAPVAQPAPVGGEASSKKARNHMARKEWVAAVEAWSAVVHASTGPLRREALLSRTDALFELGEEFLAERQLRGTFLHDSDPEARAEARRRLERYYQNAADDDALEVLCAAAVFLDPSPANLRKLAQTLMDQGEYDLALLSALLPAEAEQPVTLMVRASAQLRWWQLYSRCVERLGDEKAYWQARAAVLQADMHAADALLSTSPRGNELKERIAGAAAIRQGLRSPDFSERVKAIHSWERWQGSDPGPFRWQADSSLAADFAGAANVYSVDRDLFAEYFIAEPNRPLRIKVAGPVSLRLEVRPLHPAGSNQPIEDWLRIERTGRLREIPIINNLPSNGLTIGGMESHVPGLKLTPVPELKLEPGLHDVSISTKNRPVLVRVYIRRPEFDPGLLPAISPETVPALAYAGFKETPPDATSIWEVLRQSLLFVPADPNLEEETLALQGNLRAAILLPTRTDSDAVFRRMCLLLRVAESDAQQRSLALALGEALFRANATTPGLAEIHGRLVRNTIWEPVTAVQSSAGVRQMDLTGWVPEGPALRTRTALLTPTVKGEQFVFGTERLLMTVMNKAPSSFRLEFTVEDAGHLPPVPAAAFLQVDEGSIEKIEFRPTPSGKKAGDKGATSLKTQSKEVKIGAGQHSVRVWLGEPVILNQFLRLRVVELPGQVPVDRVVRRTYQVATKKQPLRMSIEGPASVRVDELQADGSTRTEYRLIRKDRELLEFAPPEGVAETLIRVFRRVGVTEKPPPWPRQILVPAHPVPPPMVSAPMAPLLPPASLSTRRTPLAELPPLAEPVADLVPASESLMVVDAYRLGTQEKGTWSIAEAYRRRLPLLEDLLPGATERQQRYDEFGELRVTHRYFDEWRNRYFETNVLFRARDGWNPTIGLTEHYRYDPDGCPLTFHLEGETYLQAYRDRAGISGDRTLWSAFARARVEERFELTPKFSHTPALAVFGRFLTEGADSPLQGLVDQDVFTRYKAQHRAGWELAETAAYRPWLDTVFRGRVGVVSNENFYTLDHVRVELLASQWLQDCEASAGYRFTQFFADRDRAQAVDRHAVVVEFSRDMWCLDSHRVQLAVDFQHEFTRNVSSVYAGLIWHVGNNRRYRDFRPDAVGFRDLRERRAAEMLSNNRAWQME